MILSASRRTDIPAFYAEWFVNRLHAGYSLTRNPMNHAQVSRITLSPDVIDCIVFWTKDPANMLPRLSAIDEAGYPYCFQFTLTPYGKDLERHLRPKDDILQTFIALSRRIGRDKVLWRYDPIILNDTVSIRDHEIWFAQMCEALHPYTNNVTISFVDLYAKVRTPLIRGISRAEEQHLSGAFSAIARKHGLAISACCEQTDLTPHGIARASCIDRKTIERICGYPILAPQDKNQREGCGCLSGIDIGAYNTCQNGCVYCYANHSESSVAANCRKHNPNSELLLGTLSDADAVTIRKMESFKDPQITL